MSMVTLALRRPCTFSVMALLIVLATPFALRNMATDIFPEIHIPVISIIRTCNGLSAQKLGQRIAGQSERGPTTTVSDIEHMESQSLQGSTVIKVCFQPTANIQTAIAQVVAIMQTQLRQLLPGGTPPMIFHFKALGGGAGWLAPPEQPAEQSDATAAPGLTRPPGSGITSGQGLVDAHGTWKNAARCG